MGLRFLAALTMGIVLYGTVFVSAVRGQDTDNNFLSSLLSGIASSLEAEQQDKAILRVFQDELGREPSDREMRRYRTLMQEDHWTEGDVRDDLRDRGDYRRHSRRAYEDPDKVVRRAYQDILHRDPDPEGLRTYRSKIIDEDWTEHDVREALRRSPEHDERSGESADKIVRRAYEDILGRQPDQSGMATYRNKIVHQGWDEHDVREDLKRSSEYRQKNTITRQQAEQIVRRAYLSVLRREPDPASSVWVDKVLREHWTVDDVARELRHSEEYRSKHR